MLFKRLEQLTGEFVKRALVAVQINDVYMAEVFRGCHAEVVVVFFINKKCWQMLMAASLPFDIRGS